MNQVDDSASAGPSARVAGVLAYSVPLNNGFRVRIPVRYGKSGDCTHDVPPPKIAATSAALSFTSGYGAFSCVIGWMTPPPTPTTAALSAMGIATAFRGGVPAGRSPTPAS